jgi:uncharacterized membrane protein YjjB (DUF3815 family)
MLVATMVMSWTATMLFFGGSYIDGFISLIYGLIVFCVVRTRQLFDCRGLVLLRFIQGVLCEKYRGLSEIEAFLSSLTIAIVGSLLDRFAYGDSLCLYGQLFGGVVWLLPGITITLGILEIFSKMIVYGSSRLIYGISMALQIGFGLTTGYKIVFGAGYIVPSFTNGCSNPVSHYFYIFLLPVMAVCIAILLQSQLTQIPGNLY